MNEIEFRQRIYTNPTEIDAETLEAIKANPAYQKILDETRQMERDVAEIVNSVSAPVDLAARLLAIPANTDDMMSGRDASKPSSNSFFQYYAIAASLLLALGIGAVVSLANGPSATEMAFGTEVIKHLYHEVDEINAITDGDDMPEISMPSVIDVMALAETQINDGEFLQTLPVRFAKPCVVLPAFHAAHLMLEGTHGAVNIIVINNPPVTTEYSIQDDRFRGVVIPMGGGNLILIGEQEENLEEIKSMFAENVEWAI